MHFQGFHGAGLGLRTEFQSELLTLSPPPLDFIEITPENWLFCGGEKAALLKAYVQKYPVIAHGLQLSIGGTAPLDYALIDALASFFNDYGIHAYSEHLSFSQDNQGYLYDLLPIPFTMHSLDNLCQRISTVQSRMGMRLAFENSSYYLVPEQSMSEQDFICRLLSDSDCLLLLDVNNVYVNSVNHQYCPYQFIEALPSEKIAYLHIAGHWQKNNTLIIDTHGASIIDPVWDLLAHSYQCHGPKPTLLERDNAIPALSTLLEDITRIRQEQKQSQKAFA